MIIIFIRICQKQEFSLLSLYLSHSFISHHPSLPVITPVITSSFHTELMNVSVHI